MYIVEHFISLEFQFLEIIQSWFLTTPASANIKIFVNVNNHGSPPSIFGTTNANPKNLHASYLTRNYYLSRYIYIRDPPNQ